MRVRAWFGSVPPEQPEGEGTRYVALRPDTLRFPLALRARRPGDRLRTRGGSKTLKKLFTERRVPGSRRASVPVLVDAGGAVLWVVGVEAATGVRPRPGEDALFLSVTDA